MKSVRGKILLCMSLTMMIALVILGGATIYLNYTSSNNLLEQTMSETANVAGQRVSKELEAYTNVALDAGYTAKLADPAESVETKKKIIDQRAEAHGFNRGNILGTDGRSIFDGQDFSDRSYFQASIKGEAYASEPVLSKVTGDYTIIISAPLWENGIQDTKVIGVVYFVPPETFLNDIVSQIHISNNSAAYAINKDGITIADNTMDTIMQQNIEEEAKTDSSLKQLAQIHARMRQGESGFAPYEINGTKKVSAFSPINGTDGWSIGVTAPQSDFMGSTYLSVVITIVILVIAMVISSVIAYMLAVSIGNPVRLCADRLQALSQGDLKSDVPVIQSKDETGVLAGATDSIVSTMRGIITDMGWGLSEIADGNFDIDRKAKELYVGDFLPLADSMDRILVQLTNTMLEINQSSDQVASGSDQVSSGAQALSQGATEQAASVEELAATINDISEQVKLNARNADQANEKTGHVREEVNRSNERMQEMLKAISEISDSSSEIQKIIKTIEDIAFQTNILALNAAVEAARAGAAGKGFAVVADEVRNLSMKSSEASKNTTALIEKTLQAIENGTLIANETAQSLITVVEGVKSVSQTMEQISSASDTQAHSIEQVTLGIDQISSVVQTNSATAEESAAASEELSGQSQIMKGLVGRFRLKQHH